MTAIKKFFVRPYQLSTWGHELTWLQAGDLPYIDRESKGKKWWLHANGDRGRNILPDAWKQAVMMSTLTVCQSPWTALAGWSTA
jgi:hypothetical protein